MSKPSSKNSQKPPAGWEKWAKAFVKGRSRCVYCGFRGKGYGAWRQLVVDHFIPRAHGGEDAYRNYVISCYRCNQFKAGFNPGGSRYKYLPEGRVRKALIKEAKEWIRQREKDQGRRELYDWVAKEIMRSTASRHAESL